MATLVPYQPLVPSFAALKCSSNRIIASTIAADMGNIWKAMVYIAKQSHKWSNTLELFLGVYKKAARIYRDVNGKPSADDRQLRQLVHIEVICRHPPHGKTGKPEVCSRCAARQMLKDQWEEAQGRIAELHQQLAKNATDGKAASEQHTQNLQHLSDEVEASYSENQTLREKVSMLQKEAALTTTRLKVADEERVKAQHFLTQRTADVSVASRQHDQEVRQLRHDLAISRANTQNPDVEQSASRKPLDAATEQGHGQTVRPEAGDSDASAAVLKHE